VKQDLVDIVLCVGNSLVHASDRRTGLRAMAGALKRGGRLLVTSRNWELEQPGGVEEVERRGRRARVTRSWALGRPSRHEIAVEVDGRTVREVLTLWPFTADELMDDLRAAGLEPEHSTHAPDVPRYLVVSALR